MRARHFHLASLPIVAASWCACTGTSFTGSDSTQGRPKAQNVSSTGGTSTSATSGDAEGPGTTTNTGENATVSGSQTTTATATVASSSDSGPSLATGGGTLCVRDDIDMNILFAVDTTGSMGSQADQVASGIPALMGQVGALQAYYNNKVKNFRVGFMGYIDQERAGAVLQPTTDLASASAFITAHSRSGDDSSDSAEGGAYAFTRLLGMAQQLTQTGVGAVNVFIVVTDAYSHDGGSCGPDCSGPRTFNTTAVEAPIATLANQTVLIFDFSPSDDGADGSGDFSDGTVERFHSPAGQWQFLRDEVKRIGAVPNFLAGAHLGDEISSGATQLVQVVQSVETQLRPCP